MFSKNQVKAILFDFDGVLVDSLSNHFFSWKEVLSKFDINVTLQDIALGEGEKAEESMMRFFREKKSIELRFEDAQKIVQEKRKIYQSLNSPKIYSEAIHFVHTCKKKNLNVGLVSGSTLRNIQLSLTENQFALFDVCVTGDINIKGKPNPDPYLYASQQLKIIPKEVIVIENAPLGITSAKSAGMYVIAITSTLPTEVLNEADYIATNFSEISIHIFQGDIECNQN